MTCEPLRLGAVGLGRGFALSARALAAHPNIELIAAASRSADARSAFERDFGGTSYKELDALLADPRVEMIYVATPHEQHREHVCACLNAGKHAVVEKPIALSISDAEAMIGTAEQRGLKLLVGPSHSYDAPVVQAAELIASGRLGRPRMLHAFNCTDFVYRPRRPEELSTAPGGGVVLSQAVHQIDVAMRLLGCAPHTVFAHTGAWDAARPGEGAYSALFRFPGGAFASLSYSGYGYFDSDIFMDNISELGVAKTGDAAGRARRALAQIPTHKEAAAKQQRAFRGVAELPEPDRHEHFGPTVVFCERGDVRLSPDGVTAYGPHGSEHLPCRFEYSRQTFAQSLVDSLRGGPAPLQSGRWGLAALRACLALLQSAASGLPVTLRTENRNA